jgi:hypothetical protein
MMVRGERQFWADCTINISERKFPIGDRTSKSKRKDLNLQNSLLFSVIREFGC